MVARGSHFIIFTFPRLLSGPIRYPPPPPHLQRHLKFFFPPSPPPPPHLILLVLSLLRLRRQDRGRDLPLRTAETGSELYPKFHKVLIPSPEFLYIGKSALANHPRSLPTRGQSPSLGTYLSLPLPLCGVAIWNKKILSRAQGRRRRRKKSTFLLRLLFPPVPLSGLIIYDRMRETARCRPPPLLSTSGEGVTKRFFGQKSGIAAGQTARRCSI